MSIKAAGAIFQSLETGRIMLGLRSTKGTFSGKWSFFGGKLKQGELVRQGLERELSEELGRIPNLVHIAPFDIYDGDKGFSYYSFLILVEKEFVPILNDESSGYAWIEPGQWPRPLHPGAKVVLMHPNTLSNLENIRRNFKNA